MNYIPIDKNNLPYRAQYRLDGQTFTFEFYYNSEGDYFTVDLYRGGEALALGEKITYGRPLFKAYADQRFPSMALVPLDVAESAERAGFAEIGESVFIYMISREELEDVIQTQN